MKPGMEQEMSTTKLKCPRKTEDIEPGIPSASPDYRFATMVKWGWVREEIARKNIAKQVDLRETTLRTFTEWVNDYLPNAGGLHMMDALLHAPDRALVPFTTERDQEIVGTDWDLPPATIDPITGDVIGGLEADDRAQADVGDDSCINILLRIIVPVAVYVFPNYNKIEFACKVVRQPRMVHSLTAGEANSAYSCRFSLGDLMGGLTIDSTQELPKME
ncbi:uncharacterized protein PV09_06217 [Verruconis gallopava]|uniref:Uncharacterized protein n=1 Tax=Verruconis gallopava TaxID=253628 RepID=A0A0D1YNX8_9PEZI|nr:uncharacterized protein PV09_06217 [Verruconis gallopava]KIW02397.1 hypothetical protein PV09_06217 [Verruconis gallopava]